MKLQYKNGASFRTVEFGQIVSSW